MGGNTAPYVSRGILMDTASLNNPFMGINPLLHEILLTQDRWQEFHNVFLTQCLLALRQQLVNTAYTVGLEQTVRIQSVSDLFTRYRPDLLIATNKNTPYLIPSQTSPTAMLAITDVMDLDDPDPDPLSVVIKKYEDDNPVAWIELLSPSNKLPFDGYYQYRSKREVVLGASIVFVELDFVHNQPPTLRYLDYSKGEEGAYPFHITALIPNPRIETGVAQVSHLKVMEKIPALNIPLLGDDELILDLEAVYQNMFTQAAYASEIARNQPQLTTYHPDDRAKILACIQKSEDTLS